MIEDPRKIGLKQGLRQLDIRQLKRVLEWPHEMVFDTFNYEDGKFCALAVGVGLPEEMTNPSQEKVFNELIKRGYKVYNTRGIEGEFYTTNRKEDLLDAAVEVMDEKTKALFDCMLSEEIKKSTQWADKLTKRLCGGRKGDYPYERLESEMDNIGCRFPKFYFYLEFLKDKLTKVIVDETQVKATIRRRIKQLDETLIKK